MKPKILTLTYALISFVCYTSQSFSFEAKALPRLETAYFDPGSLEVDFVSPGRVLCPGATISLDVYSCHENIGVVYTDSDGHHINARIVAPTPKKLPCDPQMSKVKLSAHTCSFEINSIPIKFKLLGDRYTVIAKTAKRYRCNTKDYSIFVSTRDDYRNYVAWGSPHRDSASERKWLRVAIATPSENRVANFPEDLLKAQDYNIIDFENAASPSVIVVDDYKPGKNGLDIIRKLTFEGISSIGRVSLVTKFGETQTGNCKKLDE